VGPQDLYQPLDPFGGAGFPGDRMEHVLSLQSLGDEQSSDGLSGFTNVCFTNLCDTGETNTCSTNICQTCSTSMCSTNIC